MTPKPLPPTEYLNECFTYDPQTGELFWKERPRAHFTSKRAWSIFKARYAGGSAGHTHHKRNGKPGGIIVSVDYRFFYAHRIIYAIMGVAIPDGLEVDHRDVDPFNNRWNNLRLATSSQNQANQQRRSNRKHNLPKGVFPKRNKFYSKILLNGEQIYLGTFTTPEEAHAAYCAKATELFGEYARFN